MGQANVLSTRAGNSTTLQKISVDTNSNGIIYMNQQDYRQVSISQSNVIDLITFEITDQNKYLVLNINFSNFIRTLIVETHNYWKRCKTLKGQTNSPNSPHKANLRRGRE